jgi:hypothetical protein
MALVMCLSECDHGFYHTQPYLCLILRNEVECSMRRASNHTLIVYTDQIVWCAGQVIHPSQIAAAANPAKQIARQPVRGIYSLDWPLNFLWQLTYTDLMELKPGIVRSRKGDASLKTTDADYCLVFQESTQSCR